MFNRQYMHFKLKLKRSGLSLALIQQFVSDVKRIFGLSSAPESSRLDVWENVSDDLSKVGGAQRAMLQVVTVSPAGHRLQINNPVFLRVTSVSFRVVSLVRLVDVLFGQTGVRMLLQVAADPVTGVKLVGCVERTGVTTTTKTQTSKKICIKITAFAGV